MNELLFVIKKYLEIIGVIFCGALLLLFLGRLAWRWFRQ